MSEIPSSPSNQSDFELRRLETQVELRRLELDIRRREIELPIQLANFGLKGSLTGALSGTIMMVFLALIGAYCPQLNINGNHLCILGAEICASVVFFGAFVFQRSFQIVVDKTKGVAAGSVFDQARPDANQGNPT